MWNIKIPTLAESVSWLEDSIITISGPLLAISSIIAGVDVVTNNALANTLTWVSFAWAYCLTLSLDFQVLALGVKAHRVYTTRDKSPKRKAFEIGLAILIAASLAYVSIQMHAIYARVNSAGVSIEIAQSQLGIHPVALIYERSTLVLVLIFMSGWLRHATHKQDSEQGEQPRTDTTHEAITALAEQMQQLAHSVMAVTTTVREVSTTVTQFTLGEHASMPRIESEQPLQIAPPVESRSGEQGEQSARGLGLQSYGDTIESLLKTEPHLTVREVADKVGCSLATAQKWVTRIRPVSN